MAKNFNVQNMTNEQLFELQQEINKEVDCRSLSKNLTRLEELKANGAKVWRGTWVEYARRTEEFSPLGNLICPYLLKLGDCSDNTAEYINIYNESVNCQIDPMIWFEVGDHVERDWLIPDDLFDDFTSDFD
jgi:hypothetical protein